MFCQAFYNRFCELMESVFSYSNTGPMFTNIQADLEQEIPFQSERFCCPSSVEVWESKMRQTQWFLMHRCESIPSVLVQFLHWSLPEDTQTSFAVFPNPSQGPCTLRIGAAKQENLICSVYDMRGVQVYVQTVPLDAGPNTITLDLPLSPGVYFLKTNERITKIIRQ